MKGLSKILLEGRIEDAQNYFQKAVGSWPVAEFQNPAGIGAGTNIQGVLTHFIQNDPSGNNKYLMWMVKMYLNPEERGTSPNDISSLVQRFHKNVDRLNVAFIMNMGIFDPSSRISTSPKNIDSYDDLSQLERVMDEMDTITTKKEKEKEAKSGVDKLYEDDRWLLVRPNTYEGSCYYGSATKWCTASKDDTTHFKTYSKTGNLYYIIDKTKDVGDFFKIAVHKNWDGEEQWFDRADDELTNQTMEAIKSLLPFDLIKVLEEDHGETPIPKTSRFTYAEFAYELRNFVNSLGTSIKLKTKTGIWDLEVTNIGAWVWNSDDPRVEVIANPFPDGLPHLDIRVEYDGDSETAVSIAYEVDKTFSIDTLTSHNFGPQQYLERDPQAGNHYGSVERNLKLFLMNIYTPKVRQIFDSEVLIDFMQADYKTWESESYVSSYQFNYPPREGTMTQKFTDYLKGNPRRTANQFYDEVLGYSRPRAHNNMFFASIKDSGIVKMEREGRQFVYSLGPNYSAWTKGKLLRTNKKYGTL